MRRRERPARHARAVPTAVALLCTMLSAHGQDAADAVQAPAPLPPYSVVPRITVSETFTDNLTQTANGQPGHVTEVAPGIRINRDVGHVRGFFDYALRGIAYTPEAQPDTTLQALSTAAEWDALDRWLLLDFSGSISQQSLSPFGAPVSSLNYGSPNSVELSSFRFAPSLQGRVGDAFHYTAQLARSSTHGNNADATNVGETQGSLELVSETELTSLGWSASVSRDHVDYSAGRDTEDDLASVGLRLTFSPQLLAFAKVGRERNNYTSIEKQSYDTHDAGLTWKPSPSTQANASWGTRSFGETHALSVEHSTELWLLRLSTQRDSAVVPGLTLPIMVFPFQGPAVIGVLNTSALSLQDRQDVLLSLRGVRDTLSLAYSQSDNTRIDTITNTVDALFRSTVHQRGGSLSLSHRLTPRQTLTLQGAQQEASGGVAQPDSRLREVNLRLDNQLSRNSQASVLLHRARYSGASDFDETALSLSLSIAF